MNNEAQMGQDIRGTGAASRIARAMVVPYRPVHRIAAKRRAADRAARSAADRYYFRLRSEEEGAAASAAASAQAREAHEKLGELYMMRARKRRDSLLDEALRDTFPASDPVSVIVS